MENEPLWLSPDLIDDRAQKSTIGLLELRRIRVRDVKVESRVLRLKKRQETTADKRLAIHRAAQVVGGVPACWHICDGDDLAKGVLVARLYQ